MGNSLPRDKERDWGYRCLALLVNYMQNSNAFEASAGFRFSSE